MSTRAHALLPRLRRKALVGLACLFTLAALDVTAAEPEAISLAGEPLYPPQRSAEAMARLEANLDAAREAFEADPSEINTIWLGRRLAYLTRYREAIAVYTEGLQRFPLSYRLYRHRGHRYISTRQFDRALADFERAYTMMPKDIEETEPDGIPNRLNIPLSSTQFNVLYHYALTWYLKGHFERAAELWEECWRYSSNDDLLVATTDWFYMSLQRMGYPDRAAFALGVLRDDMTIIENDSYYKRLRMYQGRLPVEELLSTDAEDASLALATQGYGVANWHYYNGRIDEARRIWDLIEATGNWSAFGYIAMEADRQREAEAAR